MQVWSILCLAIILSDTYLGSLSAESQLPLTRYAIDVERYRFGSSPDHMDPAFYPIPQIKVTRDTYLQEVDTYPPRGDRKKSESRDERTTNLHANPSKICSDIRFTMGDSLHRYA